MNIKNLFLTALTSVLFMAFSTALAHKVDNRTGTNIICGVENIPLSNIGRATKNTNPLTVKHGFLAEELTVTTCDYGDGIAVVAVRWGDAGLPALIKVLLFE